MNPHVAAAQTYLRSLQDRICRALEEEDGVGTFREDAWTRPEGGGGRTRVLAEGAVFEKAGVNFSHVTGARLPPSATAHRPELAGRPWEALGVSVVAHPRNPYVPTAHANVRFISVATPPTETPVASAHATVSTHASTSLHSFSSASGSASGAAMSHSTLDLTPSARHSGAAAPGAPAWWFGGGFDLTPYYGFESDAAAWHRTARDALAPFGEALYPRFKTNCDEYFFLKHRGEPRGIGGLFYDDFNELGFERSFALTQAVGDAFLAAYRPIVAQRKTIPHGDRERQFQLYRRGRYVEFNLVWDRGTLFGLQSGGRTESILMSLPPLVRWDYDWQPEPGSAEAKLYDVFLKPKNWADVKHG